MKKRKRFDLSVGTGYPYATCEDYDVSGFLESEQRISSEVKMDYIVHVLDESLLLEDMMNEFLILHVLIFSMRNGHLRKCLWIV